MADGQGNGAERLYVDVLRVHGDGHMEVALSDGRLLSVQGIDMQARPGRQTTLTLTIDRVKVEAARADGAEAGAAEREIGQAGPQGGRVGCRSGAVV